MKFSKGKITRLFLLSLFAAVLSYIVWFLQLPSLFNQCWVINNSALVFLLISTFALIISTFLIGYITYVYYVPEKLVNHLIRLYKSKKKEDDRTFYFEAISKILFYSINKADETLARTLLQFYYDAFILFRKDKEEQLIEYPQE